MIRFVEVNEILYKDGYRIKKYQKKDFDYIIDIGANTGTFTLISHICFPDAKIFAYEPCTKTYQKLIENLHDFSNINFIHKAFGDGGDLFLKVNDRERDATNQFIKEDTGKEKQKSVTLKDILTDNNIDMNKNVLLKIDIEGGEECLLTNEYNDILKKCKHFTFEAHFKCKNVREFDHLPEWSMYDDWVHRIFKETHNVLYHMSRKKMGYGIYVIDRNDYHEKIS
jgi:FkbM family methyltransferase